MRTPLFIATIAMAISTAAIAKDELTLEDVRAMSDDELYALAETLSSEDETRLYQQARKEFPEGALGLQAVLDELEKSTNELSECTTALKDDEKSKLRALRELEPGRYLSLLRIVSKPSDDVLDMTPDERKAESKRATRETNRILRDFRECKREYRKRFGDD